MKIVVNGIVRDATQEEIQDIEAVQNSISAAPLTKIYKSDMWRRCTESEAEAIDGMLKAQPVRLRRLWDDASFLSTTDEFFGLMHVGAVSLFGEDRANELLQPTE